MVVSCYWLLCNFSWVSGFRSRDLATFILTWGGGISDRCSRGYGLVVFTVYTNSGLVSEYAGRASGTAKSEIAIFLGASELVAGFRKAIFGERLLTI